jgi:uncharacterized protein YfdQ (DUF2303 family)
MAERESEAAAVANEVRRGFVPHMIEIPTGDGALIPVVATPQGMAIWEVKKFLDPFRRRPERTKGVATLHDLESFIAHTNRAKGPSSAIFADQTSTTLLAVYDYHHDLPGWCEHGAAYTFPLSDEWRAWQKVNGTPLQQNHFASFLEERVLDVIDPATAGESARAMAAALGCDFASPSRLLELSRGLEIRVAARAREKVNLSTGETQIAFETQHADEHHQPLKVPSAFVVGIPVFKRGDAFQIAARLRYRFAGEGKILWSYELYRAERCLDVAFGEACARAAKETGLPLFYGAPETDPREAAEE